MKNVLLLDLAGNDREGQVALTSLSKVGVDVSNVITEDKATNVMNIIIPNSVLKDNSVLHSWYSPITMDYTMNFSNNLPKVFPDCLQGNQVFLILDKFLPINLDFLISIKNRKVCLDIGHIRYFEHFTRQYLLKFFEFADYLQINDNSKDLLFDRLCIKNEVELFELLDLELLVITEGKKGASFLFRENGHIQFIHKAPTTVVEAIDTTGAGDAFFSAMLKEYAYSDVIDTPFVNRAFDIASSASRDILLQTGGRKA